jgi:hypothetical protein
VHGNNQQKAKGQEQEETPKRPKNKRQLGGHAATYWLKISTQTRPNHIKHPIKKEQNFAPLC